MRKRKQSTVPATFRRNVRRIMEIQDVTIRALAKSAGMSYSGLSRVLSGHQDLTLQRAEAIAKALAVPLSDIIEKDSYFA